MDPLIENLELAASCGCDPTMLLVVAVTSIAPASVDEGIAALQRLRPALQALLAAPRDVPPRSIAHLPPELRFEPELARVRPDVTDHELRGRLLFKELVGRRSFFAVAAWAIAGIDLDERDAELLEHLGVNGQLLDARIWPLTIARRLAAKTRRLEPGLIGGLASLLNPNMTSLPIAGFMRFLDRLERDGRDVETQLAELVARRERVPGIGRPALGHDERNAQAIELAARHGRSDGRSFQTALAVDRFFARTKGQHINVAGLQGAIMRDLGFSPMAASALCVLYFVVPVVAQVVFTSEQPALASRAA